MRVSRFSFGRCRLPILDLKPTTFRYNNTEAAEYFYECACHSAKLLGASESGIKTIFTAAIAGLVIFSVTTFYTDFLKQPNIDLMLTGQGHNQSTTFATINITNDGGESASNLKVTLNSNAGLSVLNPSFYTENVTAGKVSDSF